jgi:hypothetical protein
MTLLDATPTTYDVTAPLFLDRVSGVRFEFHTPFARPDLWDQYLEGALATYRAYGVEGALELDEIRSGLSTTLFVVGISLTGEVVAGARFVGPILDPSEAHLSQEFAGSTGEAQVCDELARRIPEGVIELKGCWAQVGHPQGRALSNTIARSVVHAMRWLDVRYACCSAAAHAARRWVASGAQVMAGLEPIPYPSEEYQTTLLWWDAYRVRSHADPEQWSLIQQEQVDLAEMAGVELRALVV